MSHPTTSSGCDELANLYDDNCSLQYRYGRILLTDHLNPKPGQNILDLGCGTGRLTKEIGQHVGTSGHVLGVDPNEERVEVAKMGLAHRSGSQPYNHPNIAFLSGEMKDATEHAPYDAIFSNFVLHWIPDSDVTITMQKVKECLKVGGRLVANITRNPGKFSSDLAYLTTGKDEETVTGVRFRSLEFWRKLCEESGLQVDVAVQNDHVEHAFESYHEYFDLVKAYTEGAIDANKIKEDDMRDFMTKHGITNLDESFVNCGSMITIAATKTARASPLT